jgi:hypothetical protein
LFSFNQLIDIINDVKISSIQSNAKIPVILSVSSTANVEQIKYHFSPSLHIRLFYEFIIIFFPQSGVIPFTIQEIINLLSDYYSSPIFEDHKNDDIDPYSIYGDTEGIFRVRGNQLILDRLKVSYFGIFIFYRFFFSFYWKNKLKKK